MKDPKIAYVLNYFPKASETFIHMEVRFLWQMGMDVRVFTLGGRLSEPLSADMQASMHRATRLGLAYLRRAPQAFAYWWHRRRKIVCRLILCMITQNWGRPAKAAENWWAFFCSFGLARDFQTQGIDHIHAGWASGAATSAWMASQLTVIPFSFNAVAYDIFPADRFIRQKLEDAVFIRSDTQYGLDYLLTIHPCKTHAVIHCGVETNPPAEPATEVLMKPPYRLLALGRFVPKKGFKFLIMAVRRLLDQGVDCRLTLAGDGPQAGMLKRLVRQLKLQPRVHFPGFVTHDKVHGYFRQSDVFISPSIVDASGNRDGIPVVLMEALNHRLPVIATHIAGIPELVENGRTGLLIRPSDSHAIARAVKALVRDRNRALEMAENGFQRVQKQFNANTEHRKVYERFRSH